MRVSWHVIVVIVRAPGGGGGWVRRGVWILGIKVSEHAFWFWFWFFLKVGGGG